MSAYTGYKIDNQSVSEVHRSEEKGDTAQLSVPFSQRFLKHMKIEILSRWLPITSSSSIPPFNHFLGDVPFTFFSVLTKNSLST